MDIEFLLMLQSFREGAGHILTDLMAKMTWWGELNVVQALMGVIYWCVSKEFGDTGCPHHPGRDGHQDRHRIFLPQRTHHERGHHLRRRRGAARPSQAPSRASVHHAGPGGLQPEFPGRPHPAGCGRGRRAGRAGHGGHRQADGVAQDASREGHRRGRRGHRHRHRRGRLRHAEVLSRRLRCGRPWTPSRAWATAAAS